MTVQIDTPALLRRVAAKQLGADLVNGVTLEPTLDSDGNEALRLRIMLTEGAVDKIDDEDLLDLLVDLRRALASVDERRTPIIEYVDVSDTVGNGDTQS